MRRARPRRRNGELPLATAATGKPGVEGARRPRHPRSHIAGRFVAGASYAGRASGALRGGCSSRARLPRRGVNATTTAGVRFARAKPGKTAATAAAAPDYMRRPRRTRYQCRIASGRVCALARPLAAAAAAAARNANYNSPPSVCVRRAADLRAERL